MIGLRGTVLIWFSSYIKSITIHENLQFLYTISSSSLSYSSGSVLGPSSSQYTSSLYIHDIIGQFPDVHYHIYSDDIQLSSLLSNSSYILQYNSQLCKCTSTIRSWLLSNNLLLQNMHF